jgi:hypothetical protein
MVQSHIGLFGIHLVCGMGGQLLVVAAFACYCRHLLNQNHSLDFLEKG